MRLQPGFIGKFTFLICKFCTMLYITALSRVTPLCNGSTTGFGPVSLGSNPDGVTIFELKSTFQSAFFV